MDRALRLSVLGGGRVSPNPYVGAVIVARGRIIGEGYHRRFGGPHAEVNAVRSVNDEDRKLLGEATMYVTLEPCSHFGKTPPCADLIVREGIPRVVVAAPDPFLKDKESGIDRMRGAGIDVEVGMMQREATWINRRFFTAHSCRRPFILLKWAQSADGFIAGSDSCGVRFSTPLTEVLMHKLRAEYDAIMVGVDTILADNPSLTCRHWPCRDSALRPLKVSFDSRRLSGQAEVEKGLLVKKKPDESLAYFMQRLYADYGITSLMVEGGSKTLTSFIDEGLVDEIRIETSPLTLGKGVKAPDPLPAINGCGLVALLPELVDGNSISRFVKNY